MASQPLSPLGKSSSISVELPRLNINRVEVTLIGDSPLIIHRWSSKAKKEMLDKQMKRAKNAKEAKDPERDFQESLYVLRDRQTGRRLYGFPVIGFKAAAVTACTSIGGITKVQARQAFHVDGDMHALLEDMGDDDEAEGEGGAGEYAIIEGSDPRPREDMVRIAMGTADIRYRGEFFPWWTTLTVRHNNNVISAEQLLNMLNTAGFGVGVGEWRPERDGSMGMFHVASEDEMGQVTAWRDKNQR